MTAELEKFECWSDAAERRRRRGSQRHGLGQRDVDFDDTLEKVRDRRKWRQEIFAVGVLFFFSIGGGECGGGGGGGGGLRRIRILVTLISDRWFV